MDKTNEADMTTYNINGNEYWLSEHAEGWLWSSKDDESTLFHESELEALQNVIEYVALQTRIAREQAAYDHHDAFMEFHHQFSRRELH